MKLYVIENISYKLHQDLYSAKFDIFKALLIELLQPIDKNNIIFARSVYRPRGCNADD